MRIDMVGPGRSRRVAYSEPNVTNHVPLDATSTVSMPPILSDMMSFKSQIILTSAKRLVSSSLIDLGPERIVCIDTSSHLKVMFLRCNQNPYDGLRYEKWQILYDLFMSSAFEEKKIKKMPPQASDEGCFSSSAALAPD